MYTQEPCEYVSYLLTVIYTYKVVEVAYYIPATTDRTAERCATIDGVETCQVAIQTNNVEVDDRGLIYLTDRADTGLHIVELTGPAAAIIDPGE